MRLIVGVDLGGTNIVVGTLPEDGSAVYGHQLQPTPVAEGPDAVVGRIVELIGKSLTATKRELGTDDLNLAGVGIGSPGPLNTQTGIVVMTPNLGWRNMPLRDRIADATGLAATLENDANCATLGEWWRGAAQGAQHVVGLTVGTGIGGGVVLDGKILHGASDVAGEIGHMTIDMTGRLCKCGNYGCLEAYASGPNIAARAVEELLAGAVTKLPDYVGGDLDRITAQVVYEAARDGDELALDVVRDTARVLGVGIATLVNILNPEIVVVAGGVTLAGDRLFAPLRAEVKRRAFRPAVDACRIVPGALPGTAGVYGAVASFKQQKWGAV
ncbi:MAG: ROK family protein [Gemmatimonadetes bacterium]|nr:ROK family protein [Gemmatimonadota bacterium]